MRKVKLLDTKHG